MCANRTEHMHFLMQALETVSNALFLKMTSAKISSFRIWRNLLQGQKNKNKPNPNQQHLFSQCKYKTTDFFLLINKVHLAYLKS